MRAQTIIAKARGRQLVARDCDRPHRTPRPVRPLPRIVVGALALLATLLVLALALAPRADAFDHWTNYNSIDHANLDAPEANRNLVTDARKPIGVSVATAPGPVDWRQEPIVPPLADDTAVQLRHTLRRGLELGLRADVFAKAGDSNTVLYGFLQGLGCSRAHLAGHPELAPTAAFFAGHAFDLGLDRSDCGAANSFSRHSAAALSGMSSSWALAGKPAGPGCLVGEGPLACEYRLVRPAFSLIMFGTLDAYWQIDEQQYADQMTAIVRFSRARGVSPILFTVPPQPRSAATEARIEAYNRVLYELSGELHVPVINLWRALQSGGGDHDFVSDGVHLSSAPLTGPGGACAPLGCGREALEYGAALRSLITLQTLRRIEAQVIAPVTASAKGRETKRLNRDGNA